LILNGKELSDSDVKLTNIGVVSVKQKEGENKMLVTYTPPKFFTVILLTTIFFMVGNFYYLGNPNDG
jgi:uncharacterized membrane protein YfhO